MIKRNLITITLIALLAPIHPAAAQTTQPESRKWVRTPLDVPPISSEWPQRNIELAYDDAFEGIAWIRDYPSVLPDLTRVLPPMWQELSAAQKASGHADVILETRSVGGGLGRSPHPSPPTITLIAPPPAGPDDLEAAVRWLKSTLTGRKLPDAERQKKVQDLQKQLQHVQDQLQIGLLLIQTRQKFVPEILMQRMQASQVDREKLELDLRAKQARSRAIRRQIDNAERDGAIKLHDDPILAQLNKVVALREQEIERLRDFAKKELTSAREVMTAEERLVEAQLRIEERKELLRQASGGDLLTRLTSELAMLMVDQAELEARLDVLQRESIPLDLTRLTRQDLERLTAQYATGRSEYPPAMTELEQQEQDLAWQLLKLIVTDVRSPEETPMRR